MIDMPDRIWAEVSPNSGDEWWTAEPSDLGKATLTEYIRADVSAARIADLTRLLAADAKAHEKEIAVWAENYAALERQLAEALAEVEKLRAAWMLLKACTTRCCRGGVGTL